MSEPLQWLNIGALPRVTEFPFRVSTVGWVDRGDAHYHGTHEGGFEFCLRLRSEEPAATDRFAGKVWRTPYPHLVVQRPGVRLHDHPVQPFIADLRLPVFGTAGAAVKYGRTKS